jgi:hypothetical protein
MAEGSNHAQVIDKHVHLEAKYYCSQDGIKWVDLPAVDNDVIKFAATCKSQLSGDPSKIYPESSGEEEADDASKQSAVVITELQRLRAMINAINADTGVVPVVGLSIELHGTLRAPWPILHGPSLPTTSGVDA